MSPEHRRIIESVRGLVRAVEMLAGRRLDLSALIFSLVVECIQGRLDVEDLERAEAVLLVAFELDALGAVK